MTAVYAGIASFLSYQVTDGLMLRWLVRYSRAGCAVRLLSFNALNIYLTSMVVQLARQYQNVLHAKQQLLLPAWVLVACVLTIAYTIENWVTSNIRAAAAARHDHLRRQLNLYEVAVFGVAPVGMASFITMCLALGQLYTM